MVSEQSRRSGGTAKWGSAVLVLVSIVLCLGLAEAVARLADNRGIFAEEMYFGTTQVVPIDKYIAGIETGRKSVGNLWTRSPPPLPNRQEPKEEDLERLREFGNKPIDIGPTAQLTTSELFKVWNSKLAADACNHVVLKPLTRWPLDEFDSPSGDVRPNYRYRPNATLPTGLVTNQIGWRGKPIDARTPDTIRIVFVGASTIAEAPALPWSAPELLDDWLNAWAQQQGLRVRFQVLNAGREGAHAADVAAVVRDEVAPLRPDLVIFYEGALEFDWSSLVENADSLKALPRPQYEDYAGWMARAARTSSVVARIFKALADAGLSIAQVGEAAKPAYKIAWPKGLDEKNPDITRQDLPLNLTPILKQFDTMRVALNNVGSEFALSSFAWIVHDGLKVDPVKGRYIWVTNNRIYWPWTYSDLRRGLDFENRVYRKYAEAHGMAFFDVANLIPAEPMLFADNVHMTESGIRVKAWAFFRELLPFVQQRLASHTWPRNMGDEPLPGFKVRREAVNCKDRS